MKKGKLLNSEISYEIAKMGHTDGLVIADSGLPIPSMVKRIDLALTENIPRFLDVVGNVLEELIVEEVVIAVEMKNISPNLYKQLIQVIKTCEKEQGNTIEIIEINHEKLKKMTMNSKCIIRTGECTPYANIILKSGVTFKREC